MLCNEFNEIEEKNPVRRKRFCELTDGQREKRTTSGALFNSALIKSSLQVTAQRKVL